MAGGIKEGKNITKGTIETMVWEEYGIVLARGKMPTFKER